MNDKDKIESILAQIDNLREEVSSLMPPPEPAASRLPEPLQSPEPPQPLPPPPPPRPYEPSAAEIFWAKVEDWICVRGDFAPKGVTREFAVATRWLVRVGALLLVGAMAYFLMLAINRGWIGPTQRVLGMMFWGVVGAVGGTWVKLRREKYAILGEVFAALGLVALYLSFGLGHRYFNPPVIASMAVAFGGLVVATAAAGVLSVRLKSLMIAGLALVGGFLVPTIARFGQAPVSLASYLVLLTLGASVIAYLRRWTAYGFAALVAAFLMGALGCDGWEFVLRGTFTSALLAEALALTMLGAHKRARGGNGFCWAFVCLSIFAWLCVLLAGSSSQPPTAWLGGAAAVLAALAVGVRRRNWAAGTGAPALIVWSVVLTVMAVAFELLECYEYDWMMLTFSVMAALIGEMGVRFREKTLEVLSLVMVGILTLVFFGLCANQYGYCCMQAAYRAGYLHEFGMRCLYLLPVPFAVGFTGLRLCAPTRWLAGGRTACLAVTSLTLFIFVSAESGWLGKLYFPTLKTGLMTIVWAASAFAILTVGIMRRLEAVRYAGLGLLGLAVAKLLFIDTASLATPARVAVFAAVGVLKVAGAFLYLKFKTLFEDGQNG